jgi:deazaflavin-dependent oxidoreductase (nitroreductase family)
MLPAESEKEFVQGPIKRVFPSPGTTLYNLITDMEYTREFHARLKQSNHWVASMYKLRILPLFGLSGQIMLLSTRGRKSLKMRDTPIGYFRIDGLVHVFSGWGKAANWYQNILAYPDDVYLQIGFHRSHVCAEVVEDPHVLQHLYEQLAMHDPHGAHMLMGWDPKEDCLELADFSLMIEKVLVVRFNPRGSRSI